RVGSSPTVRTSAWRQPAGELTVAQLAERIHLSTSPAWRRVKRLEHDGLITGYHAAISRRGLGWGVRAFVSVAIESHSEQEARAFETAVAALPEIVACWSITGSSDFCFRWFRPISIPMP